MTSFKYIDETPFVSTLFTGEQQTDVHLTKGEYADLPEDNEHIKVLIEQGKLIKESKPAEIKEQPKKTEVKP